MNILIELMTIVALVFAPVLVANGGIFAGSVQIILFDA